MDLSQSELLTKANLFLPEYGSRSEDDERRSTCPLIPSPILEFTHPLAQLPTTPSDIDKGGLSPSSVGTEISSVPPELPLQEEDDAKDLRDDLCEEKRSSTSSSSSGAIQETASAQLLHSHNRYMSLSTENKCQENGGLKSSFGALTLTKATREYAFLSWNWPLIRKWCFWSVMSATIACVCVIIGYIGTIPIKCDPQHKWYQGVTFYQVFPASFQDYNHDGVGDLKGFATRAPYLQKLGVRAVRISFIFPTSMYPENYYKVTNLTAIEPSVGTLQDFESLIKSLHDKNISAVLDLPLYPYFDELKVVENKEDDEINELKHVIVNNHILATPNTNRTHAIKDGRGVITDIIKFWVEKGVDGFYLEGLEELAEDPRLANQIFQWKDEMKSDQILICSSEVLARMNQSYLSVALENFDMIEYRLDPPVMSNIINTVKSVLSGDLYKKKGYPWPFWTLGSLDTPRLSSRINTRNMTLAMTAITAMLPGSNGLLYGDEIGLHNSNETSYHHRDSVPFEFESHSVGPMLWITGGRTFTPAHVLPWHPHSLASLSGPQVQSVLKKLSTIRDTSPSLYMSYICTGGIIHPNTVIRDLGDNVISLERSYPRRHTYLLVANIGTMTVTKDLSNLHYGGRALLDHAGPIDLYTSFKRLTLYPGEFVLVKLDR